MKQINYIKHKNIDFKKWDALILSSEFPVVFAQAFYLNATSPNWDALVIGDYEAVFPITHKKKLGIQYLPQPHFTSQLGAFGKISIETETLFYNYINKQFKLIELELNASNKLNVSGIKPKKTFTIRRNSDISYNQNTKRNIKKGIDNNFVINKIGANVILDSSKKYINPFLADDLKFSKKIIGVFNQLLSNALAAGSLVSFEAKDSEGKVRAMAHFVFNERYALYLKGTNFDKKDNSGSMHLLMDYAINYFRDKVEIFDFGGGSENDSLARFYHGLGGQVLEYSFLKVNQLPLLIKALKK